MVVFLLTCNSHRRPSDSINAVVVCAAVVGICRVNSDVDGTVTKSLDKT